MRWLDLELEKYHKEDVYSFHMPGHKGLSEAFFRPELFYDITEIPGFDDLMESEDLLKDLQQVMAELYGAGEAFLLTNGSTCGNLVGLFSVAKPGDTVLLPRFSHKSLYHGTALRDVKLHQPLWQGPKDITANSVKAELSAHPEIKVLCLTHPTYEGELLPLEEIYTVCKEHGVYLLIDSAHGAHFGLGSEFPESAVHFSDLCVISLHKTLPVLGQAAAVLLGQESGTAGIVQMQGAADSVELPDSDTTSLSSRIAYYRNVFNTSSPSYLIMASVAYCLRQLKAHGPELFSEYYGRLSRFYEEAKSLRHLKLTPMERRDPGKLWVTVPKGLMAQGIAINGITLADTMRKCFKLEPEMAIEEGCLFMTSYADTEEGFRRLMEALRTVDREAETLSDAGQENCHTPLPAYGECVYTMHQAEFLPKEEVSLNQAVGRICGRAVALYPPGIPLFLPGERISEEAVAYLERELEAGRSVEGLSPLVSVVIS